MRPNARVGLMILAGISGLIAAVITVASGATLALDGTGRYALLAQLAFISAILLLSSGVALLLVTFQRWQGRSGHAWVRWLAGGQVVLIGLALVVGSNADLRAGFYLLLLLGILSNGWLWLAANQA